MSWMILYSMRKTQRLHKCLKQFFFCRFERDRKRNVGENVLNANLFLGVVHVSLFVEYGMLVNVCSTRLGNTKTFKIITMRHIFVWQYSSIKMDIYNFSFSSINVYFSLEMNTSFTCCDIYFMCNITFFFSSFLLNNKM